MGRKTAASNLSDMSVKSLHEELRRRERTIGSIRRKRERLVSKIQSIDAMLLEMGATPGGGMRKRPKNKANLALSLAKVLKGKTMGVTEVANAVKKSGYLTTAANFRTIVNQCLIKHRNLFKKVGRGKYTAA